MGLCSAGATLCPSLTQVMRCVREARQKIMANRTEMENVSAAPACLDDDSLCVKNWLPGSYSRLKRSLESAISHPTGRGIPILWRIYMSLEVCAICCGKVSAAYFFVCPWRLFMVVIFCLTKILLFLSALLRQCVGITCKLNICFGGRFTRALATSPFGWTLFAATNVPGWARQD